MKKYINIFATALIIGVSLSMQSAIVTGEEIESEQQINTIDVRSGLHGIFFKNENFSDIVLIGQTDGGVLGINEEQFNLVNTSEKVNSFVWSGIIIPTENLKGIIEVSQMEQLKIRLNNAEIKMDQEIFLEKNKEATVTIEAIGEKAFNLNEVANFQLKVGNHVVTREELFLPTYEKDEWKEHFKKQDKSLLNFVNPDDTRDEWTDTDGDAIPDKWEREGYTIQAKKAVAWKKEFADLGYTKFTSNPYEAHTVGDPYTDLQKAAKDIPQSNAIATNHPLVAAYPNISTTIEKMKLSSNQLMTNPSSSVTQSDYTLGSVKTATSDGSWSGLGGYYEISKNYSHGNDTTTVWGSIDSNGNSILHTDSAFLDAQVRYKNIGTGAIYDVQPRSRFFIDDMQIGHITEKANPTGLNLDAQGTYPSKNQPGLGLTTFDDFNRAPIKLNKQQKNNFLNGEEDIKIYTEQIYGRYPIKMINGTTAPGGEWQHVLHQIENHTASLMLDLGNEYNNTSNVRVAAKNYNDPEDHTPELTLGDALLLAYPEEVVKEKDGIYRYKGISISEGAMNIYTDEDTAKKINAQLADKTGPFKNVNYIYQVKLEKKMQITLRKSEIYEDFEVSPINNLFTFSHNIHVGGNIPGPCKTAVSGYKSSESVYRKTTKEVRVNIEKNVQDKFLSNKIYKFSYFRSGTANADLGTTWFDLDNRNAIRPIYSENKLNSQEEPKEVVGETIYFDSLPEYHKNFKKQSINVAGNYKVGDFGYKLIGFYMDPGVFDDFSFMCTELPAPKTKP
ncbi:binary toxin-like calcium binding domain-containing protein [Enterococcus faecalis]|uniref:binary toxin-like calcium binding domain-containing protein n=1 Tax=Enterococcus faecalis TaxID=1351 RepID=UPI0035EA293C